MDPVARQGAVRPILGHAARLWLRLRLNEIGPLLSLAAFSLFAWIFVVIAGEVIEGDTESFDQTILLSLRNPANLADPIGPSWVEETARDFTGLGGHPILALVTFGVAVYLWMVGKRRTALFVVAAIGGGMLLSAVLKIGFERPRPALVPHEVRVYTASFPSGHAMLSATTYLTLGALLARANTRRRVKTFVLGFAVALTLMIGLSRIYLGVHWPSDVLAGWCGGAAWAALCWFVALQLQRKGQVEPPSAGTESPSGRGSA
jgi:undecaprenyl-diphosphatase